jgi:hypothetical protein
MVIYVDVTSKVTPETGSKEAPFTSITSAINNAKPGDSVTSLKKTWGDWETIPNRVPK